LSLRAGECGLALVVGVTVLATPEVFVEFSRQRGLAPDGRCKSFAAAADGVGWGEGVGVLVVEKLSDALRNDREIFAVVKGSAVNQDGASNGLTAPNGPAQQRVIRAALANAGLSVSDIDVLEAHGTGTKLGDPIEAQAVLATYGQRDRDGEPLWLGSVKSNMGHTQAAAGVAGVIKMIHAMRHGILPKTLHVDEPTPHVDWSSGHVRLLTEQRPWPDLGRPRRAAVSSFGISGTNAHVILEQPPTPPDKARFVPPIRRIVPSEERTPKPSAPQRIPWVVSARSRAALSAQCERLHEFVTQRPELNVDDVGVSLARRTVFEYRTVVCGTDRESLLTGLRTAGAETPTSTSVRAAFVFPGQGTQWPGMGRELYERYSVFAAAWDAITEQFGVPLRDTVWGIDSAALARTEHAQAGLFAVEVALFRLLESWGLVPDAVAGHSVGEIAAAHVAGVLSLADAVRVVSARAALMQSLPDDGAMIAVRADADEVRARLRTGTEIAAVNSPRSVVISGRAEAVEQVVADFAAQGRRTKRLTVSHAFHSPLIDPVLADLAADLHGISTGTPDIPVVSNLTGEFAAADYGSADYWVRHARQTVRFADGIAALRGHGISQFVEVGPGSGLTAAIAEIDADAVVVPTMRKDRGEQEALLDGVARSFVHGRDVEWQALFHETGARRISLPTYAFQHEHYWISAQRGAVPDTAASTPHQPADVGEPRTAGEPERAATHEESLYHVRWSPVEPERPGDLDRAEEAGERTGTDAEWEHVRTGGPVPELVVLRVDGAADDLAAGMRDTTHRVLTAIRTWLTDDRYAHSRLLVLTHGAIDVAGKDVADLASAPVWGLVRAAQAEHPGRILLADTDDSACPTVLTTLDEPEFAIRDGQLLTPRFTRLPGGDAGSAQPGTALDTTGTVLVIGGTTGYGAQVAQHLVAAYGARRLVLTAREPVPEGVARPLLGMLAASGAEARIEVCDPADRTALRHLLAGLADAGTPLGIVYTAPSPPLGLVRTLTAAQLDAALRDRAAGAWHLHELTAEMDLSFLLLLSAATGTVLPAAQACDAAGNAFLAALTSHRNGQGLPATALAWGPWTDLGVGALTTDLQLERLRRQGISPLGRDEALNLFDRAVRCGEPVLHPVRIDATILADRTDYRPALLRRLVADAARAKPESTPDAARTGPDGPRDIAGDVRAVVAAALGHRDPGAVEPDRPFLELGVESLSVMDIQAGLRRTTGIRLSPMEILDSGSITGLTVLIASRSEQPDAANPGNSVPAPADLNIAQLFRAAVRARTVDRGLALISAAADLRPTFDAAGPPPTPLALSRGPADPLLVCVSAPIITGGIHQYMRIARQFEGRVPVSGLPLAGFGAGESLPATPASAVAWLCDAVEHAAGGRPIVLVGYSSGGVLAHAVAGRLAVQDSAALRGLVMLDSFRPDAAGWGAPMEPLFAGMLGGEDGAGDSSLTVKLTAMAMWGRHLRALPLDPLPLPVLFVRCTKNYRPPGGLPEFPLATPWQPEHTVREVGFDHFTLLTDGAADVAGHIAKWLAPQ
ncbi:type I polyketide synthase, partial [Nocardia nova]|uniref:type I polyketide synthase n=3 Tax=Nocardia nova TaxID=37330 RepID=UPI0018962CE8|nr:acyltransferase domain-containing protein [Nocardia nova]